VIDAEIRRNEAKAEAERDKRKREADALKAKQDKIREEKRRSSCSENDPLCGAK
jgi:hypothetical protein